MDAKLLKFCNMDFNYTKLSTTDNLYIARKINGVKTDIRSFRIPGVDPRIKLSATHVCAGEKEFIVFRFKYARHHITPAGTKISAKVCFLDISICKEYDNTYTHDEIPNSFHTLYSQAINKTDWTVTKHQALLK